MIQFHRHHEFDFIHQTNFHFMVHLCVQFHVYGQIFPCYESHGFGGLDMRCLESFYPIRYFHLCHGIHPNL